MNVENQVSDLDAIQTANKYMNNQEIRVQVQNVLFRLL